MQAKKRLSEASIIQSLIDEPQRFQFAQIMRILLRWLAQNGISSERAFAEILRFPNSLALEFPASDVESLQAAPVACDSDTTLLQALRRGDGARVELTSAFFGLLGVNGALPLHHTERIAAARRQTGDIAPHAFVDMFSQRLMVLYFLAWGKYRLEYKLDVHGIDGQLPLLMALAGMRPAQNSSQSGVSDNAVAYYAALLGARPVAASSISRVLSDHFGVPIELEPFVGAWDTIPASKRSKLGSKIARLGHGATLGGRLRRRDIRARLNIGPLSAADVERFLPRHACAGALSKMVSLFGLDNLKIDVRLLLQSSSVKRLVLTSKSGAAGRLGWDAFLVGRGGKVSRTSVDYPLQPPPTDNSEARK